jgi:DNA-binding XRE family transcriptional regulator
MAREGKQPLPRVAALRACDRLQPGHVANQQYLAQIGIWLAALACATVGAWPLASVDFGLAVRRLRTSAGYSQEAFADACRIHRTSMGTLERGGNPRLATVVKIVWQLDISLGDLFVAVDSHMTVRESGAPQPPHRPPELNQAAARAAVFYRRRCAVLEGMGTVSSLNGGAKCQASAGSAGAILGGRPRRKSMTAGDPQVPIASTPFTCCGPHV